MDHSGNIRRHSQTANGRRWSMRWTAILAFGLLLFSPRKLLYADFSWVGSSGSWTDPGNWINTDQMMNTTYPQGGDNAKFYNPGNVSLDGGQAAKSVDIGTGNLSFASGSLAVSGTNLLRIGAGGFSAVNLLSGGTLLPNGTIIGLNATASLTIYAGATLNDSHEIDVGYTDLGNLDIFDGGSATSAGPVFVGGFSSGDGEIIVSGQAASLTGNGPYIVVGNLGKGSMIVTGAGKVTSTNDFIIAGFSSGQGAVSLYDSNSSLQVTNNLSVGSFGSGTLTVGTNASVTAKNISVGDGSTGTGLAFVNSSGATLTASAGSLTVGNDGTGILTIISGGHMNVQGSNSFAVIGANATGNGTVLIAGSGSQLNVTTGSLTVGKFGTAILTVTDHGTVNAQGLLVGFGFGPMASVVIDGAGSSIQANSTADIGVFNKGTLSIINGGQLLSQIGSVGLVSGNGIVNINGQGSAWQIAGQLNLGVGGEGGILITQGGKLEAQKTFLGVLATGDGTLALDGPDSKVVGDVAFGSLGRAAFHLRHGATYTFNQAVAMVNANGSVLTVEDPGSAVECPIVAIGGSGPQAKGVFEVSAGGKATVTGPTLIINGELDVGQGSTVLLSEGVGGGANPDTVAQVNVQGAGAVLLAGKMVLGGQGTATMNINGGGLVQTQLVDVLTDGSAGSQGTISVGSGSRLLVDSEITFTGPKALQLTVQGGLVSVRSYLNLGNATLSLSGGSVDVGALLTAPESNFVRVGPGGEFHSAAGVSNLHNFGGIVQAGSSPGTMTVSGNYIQDNGSILRFSINGATPGTSYSELIVNGNLQLSGTLRFVFEDGFTPQPGQMFDVIQVGGTKQLSNYQIEIQNLAPGFQYDFSSTAGGYRLTALSAATFNLQFKPGDFNGDGSVTTADIPAMLSALADLNVYQQSRHMAVPDLLAVGDLDGSGNVDNRDIQSLLNLIGGPGVGSIDAVPEPSSIILAGIAALVGCALAPIRCLKWARGPA